VVAQEYIYVCLTKLEHKVDASRRRHFFLLPRPLKFDNVLLEICNLPLEFDVFGARSFAPRLLSRVLLSRLLLLTLAAC
jgi:hypothetical protein